MLTWKLCEFGRGQWADERVRSTIFTSFRWSRTARAIVLTTHILTYDEWIIVEHSGFQGRAYLCTLLASTKVDQSSSEVFNLSSLMRDEMSKVVVGYFKVLYVLVADPV